MERELKIYETFRQTFDHEEAVTVTKYLYEKKYQNRHYPANYEIQHLSIELNVQEKVSDIEIYKIFERKFGDKNALIFVNGIESLTPKNSPELADSKTQQPATKEDLESIKVLLKSTTTHIIRWMFIFSVGFVIVMTLIMYFMFSHFL